MRERVYDHFMARTSPTTMDSSEMLASAQECETALNEIAGHLNAQHARLVDTAILLLANPSWWRDESVATVAKYLCWRTAIAPERAKQLVTIAERADELPICMARFRAGELSVDHMAAIARRAPWWVDAELAELAPMLTTHQLRGTLATYQFPLIPKPREIDLAGTDGDGVSDVDNDVQDGGSEANPDRDDDSPTDTAVGEGAESGTDSDDDADVASEPSAGTDDTVDASADADVATGIGSGFEREPVQAESLWFGWDDEGRFQIHGVLATDSGLVVESALKEAADRLFHEAGTTVAWPDALCDIAHRSLDQIESPARRDRYRIHLALDTDGTCTDGCGRWLPDAIRRHIGCDGTVSPTFLEDGAPISVGRSQHIVPARTRRQVLVRDHGTCRVPGCGNATFVEIHHIIHWEHLGVTEPWNLLSLCPQHHRLHHRGQLGIAGNADEPDGVTFTNRHGRPIPASGASPEPPPAPPEPPRGNFRHPLGERLEGKWLTFNPPRPRDDVRPS